MSFVLCCRLAELTLSLPLSQKLQQKLIPPMAVRCAAIHTRRPVPIRDVRRASRPGLDLDTLPLSQGRRLRSESSCAKEGVSDTEKERECENTALKAGTRSPSNPCSTPLEMQIQSTTTSPLRPTQPKPRSPDQSPRSRARARVR